MVCMKRMTATAVFIIAGAAFIVMSTIFACAGSILSKVQIRRVAIEILRGDPYGNSSHEVLQNIGLIQLVSAGTSKCGRLPFPVWQIHVVVPKERVKNGDSKIDGWLVLNARTGKMVCAGLPFLD